MSFKIEHKGPPTHNTESSTTVKDAYGLPVESYVHGIDQNVTYSYVPYANLSGGKTVFGNGVRVPFLKDIESKYTDKDALSSCRFDVVEKVKPGTQYTGDVNQMYKNMTSLEQRFVIPRQPTFHYTNQHYFDHKDKDILTKVSPYHWCQYVKSGKDSDARDVLYKNTYCLDIERLRFRSSTLPRIASERPCSVRSEGQGKSIYSRSNDSSYTAKEITIIPQQPRGTIVRFREYIKPITYSSSHKALEIKRIGSSHHEPTVDNLSHMRYMLPLIRHDSRRAARGERPLKFEQPRYRERGLKNTLFNRQIHHPALEPNYVSAETFKEYLETLQMNATRMPVKHGRENQYITAPTTRRQSKPYDVNAHALQSVVDVNQPDGGNLNAPPATEDNARSQDNPSPIAIEIKSSWQNERDTGSDILKVNSRKSEVQSAEPNTNAIAESAHFDKEEKEISNTGSESKEPQEAEDASESEIFMTAKREGSKPSSVIKIPSSRDSDSEGACEADSPRPNI